MDIKIFLSSISTIFILVVFLFYTYFFFKRNLIYKLVTIYLLLNVFIRLFNLVNIENVFDLSINSLFIILQFYVVIGIYYFLLRNKYLIYLAIATIPFSIFVLLFYWESAREIFGVEIAITYVSIFLMSSSYSIMQIDKENKTYLYFNKGLLIYVFSTIIIFSILISVKIIFKTDFTTEFVYLNYMLEIIFFIFIFKEWFVVGLSKNIKNIKNINNIQNT